MNLLDLSGLLLVTLGTPFALAVVALLAPRGIDAAWSGVAASAPLALLGLGVTTGHVGPGVIEAGWLMLGAPLGIDAVTGPFALLTGVLWGAASVALAGYFDASARRAIAPWWLLALAGNVALPLALGDLAYFMFFAVMSFASYALVVQRGDGAARRAGRVYLTWVLLGEVVLFAGLVLNATHPGWAGVALLAGFGVKVGLPGLHVWLPLAHGAAPAPASAVLSGAMLKAGLLGWLRFFEPESHLVLVNPDVLMALGIGGALAGALAGLCQRDAKTVLAYSSLSQMGLITLAFGATLASGRAGAAALAPLGLLAMHHALAKGALFLSVPWLEKAAGGQRRLALLVVGLAGLALVGLPFTSGYLAKNAIKAVVSAGAGEWVSTLTLLLPVAATGTALVMARLLFVLPASNGVGVGAATVAPPTVLLLTGFGLLVFATTPLLPGPTELAAAAAPLGIAALLTLAARWSGRGPPPLPAGDILALLARPLAVTERALLAASAADPGDALARRARPLGDRLGRMASGIEGMSGDLGNAVAVTTASVAAALVILLGFAFG